MLFVSVLLLLHVLPWDGCALSPYQLISSTAWIIDTETFYPDFSASITPDYRPTIFQYFYNHSPTVFSCDTRDCSSISTTPMPGLFSAHFALSGVSPRRIQQSSPNAPGGQFLFSKGYATPNKDVEVVVCSPSDPSCEKPLILNTVNSPGFGQAGLRLAFTRQGLPMMIIPEARYASQDNRVTGYTIQTCADPLCARGLVLSRVSLPFNLTGKAYCEGTSVDVALNRFGLPTWLTLCGPELNLIHCLTPSCNETSVVQFVVNRDLVYFVYLAVDSRFRFSISTTGQTAQSDITYIRCLDADCAQSTQYQLAIPSLPEGPRQKIGGRQVQHVIDPQTDCPVFHFVGSEYPSDRSVYMFIACADLDCSQMPNVVDYGVRLGINRLRVSDLFVDDQGVVIASSRASYEKSNQTINLIVRIARTEQSSFDGMTFVRV